MPVALRAPTSKAQSKYNVTTDFPSLGLHAAAATANVGLLEYALSRGQPVNSVVDGILPLHAACAGGTQLHEAVVKKLIEHGADVNAPRLPRRYSNEKNRDNTQPIIGASGSTPLHFAAANGNTNTVKILLDCGAVPDRPDKHGVTPEMLAQRNGWLECAELLRTWTSNLRDKEGTSGSAAADTEAPPKKRLQMKQSVEHALHKLKSSSSQTFDVGKQSSSSPTLQEASSPTDVPFGEYTFYSGSPKEVDHSTRRPSFPQAIMERMHKDSIQSTGSDSCFLKHRRPSSAGTDADRAQTSHPASIHSATATPPPGRKSSKISLFSVFKKSQPSGDLLSSADQSTSSLPLFDPNYSLSSPSSKSIPLPQKESNTEESPHPKRAIDMHNALAQQSNQDLALSGSSPRGMGLQYRRPSNPLRPQHLRDRSGSRSSANRSGTVFEDDFSIPPESTSTPPQRPSILRTHQRSSSSSAPRALRFDSSSSIDQSSASRLRGSNSASSLGRSGQGGRSGSVSVQPQSAPPYSTDFSPHREIAEDEEEEEYGEVIQGAIPCFPTSRPRQSSMVESEMSLSPIVEARSNFPFSIRQPPISPEEDEAVDTRGRGDSFSSVGSSSNTSSTGSAAVTVQSPPNSPQKGDLPRSEGGPGTSPVSLLSERNHRPYSGRRSFSPTDNEIRAISSHAEAKELVQRAQQSILEMEHHTDDDEGDAEGWTPLSAKLAAYGKSLAVERMMREGQDRKLSETSEPLDATNGGQPPVPLVTPPAATLTSQPPTLAAARSGVSRQSSLKTTSHQRQKTSSPRRPNTSSGAPERDRSESFQHEPRFHRVSLSSNGAPSIVKTSPPRSPPHQPRPSLDTTRSSGEYPNVHPIVRSHTPRDELEETPTLSLHRIQTAADHSERNSNKLARMGLTMKNPEPVRPSGGGRFGAIKSLFKGGKP